jgi:hypothetical protein
MTMRVFVSGEYRCDAWQLLWTRLSLSDGWLHLHGSCGKGLGFQRDASSMATLPKRQNHQPCCHLLGRRACPGLQACCALRTRSIQMKISDSRRCTCTTFSQRQACMQEASEPVQRVSGLWTQDIEASAMGTSAYVTRRYQGSTDVWCVHRSEQPNSAAATAGEMFFYPEHYLCRSIVYLRGKRS